jgi:hypothetical protein
MPAFPELAGLAGGTVAWLDAAGAAATGSGGMAPIGGGAGPRASDAGACGGDGAWVSAGAGGGVSVEGPTGLSAGGGVSVSAVGTIGGGGQVVVLAWDGPPDLLASAVVAVCDAAVVVGARSAGPNNQ